MNKAIVSIGVFLIVVGVVGLITGWIAFYTITSEMNIQVGVLKYLLSVRI